MALRAYRPASYPQIEAGVPTYISNEYDKIAQALASLAENLPPDLSAAPVSFSAHKNGTNQTLANVATDQKVTFTTEAWDTGGFYDAANSKWTPSAGLVQLTAQVMVLSATDQVQYYATIYKNGAQLKTGNSIGSSGTINVSLHASVLDRASGTDYYEVFIAMTDAVSKVISGGAIQTYFQGTVIK